MKNLNRKILGLVAVVVLVAVGAVAGPWIYINLIKQDAPEALTLEPAVSTTVATTAPSTVSTTLEPAVSTTIAPGVDELSANAGAWLSCYHYRAQRGNRSTLRRVWFRAASA